MERREILVIDDSARFPLHVWRYITGCLGFGIGEVGVDGNWGGLETGPVWISEHTSLTSEDGCHRLWWVPADSQALTRLGTLFQRFEAPSRVYALIDVHGKRGSSYRVDEIRSFLEEQRTAQRVSVRETLLVSAYHSGHRLAGNGKPVPVHPKSRETLRLMAGALGTEPKGKPASPWIRHILVTGAGFEIGGERGGFGMPPTREILLEMGAPFEMRPLAPQEAFPVPGNGIWTPAAGDTENLEVFAEERNLDSYWDFLLERELQFILGTMGRVTAEKRDERKARALWQERCLREAFRRSILHHDWGFMNQSLDAARLPWHAWLTTNYTQFANRAISLFSGEHEELGMWRIISTAAEARTLTREGAGAWSKGARHLFKLHGDIAHLQTMAIAGHDKDLFSPLSMPVEDLYEVYAAAERFLMESLKKDQQSLVAWHIVGHGLQDRRLCELLARVWSHTRADQVFVIVNPQAGELIERLREALQTIERAPVIYPCGLAAAKYMARLRRLLLGAEEEFRDVREAEELRRWLCAAELKAYDPPSHQPLF
ncbi:MAG TPA: SIR2 family protein [Thermoanaerobaculia bacterium]|nr:SIR2 family protein [Thermoanaerobaculia bacterium]